MNFISHSRKFDEDKVKETKSNSFEDPPQSHCHCLPLPLGNLSDQFYTPHFLSSLSPLPYLPCNSPQQESRTLSQVHLEPSSSSHSLRMGNKSWKSSPVFISEEILIEILLRLPVKSLIRFSCVSKSWRDVIRSSSFITNHLSKNMTRYSNRYLIANYPVDPSTVEPDLCQYNLYSSETFEQCLKLEHPLWTTIGRFEQCLRLKCSLSTASRCVIYGSSNGLLCISDSDVVTQSPICIWNPSIRKFRILPQPTLFHLDHYCFDTVLSFGFHPVLKDYKVVMLQCFDVVEEGDLDVKIALGVQVYTFSTNSWKMNEVMRLDWDWKPCAKCAVLNGISYWLAEEVSAEASVFRILSFDTGNEEFEHFRVPEAIANVDGGLYIEVYKDSICLLEVDYCSCEDDDGGHIHVWLLQEQTFNLLQTIVLPSSGTCIPLGFTMDNQLLVEVLEDDDDNYQLALFVPESKQLLRTPILLPVHTRSQVHTYNESLVLLDDERVINCLDSKEYCEALYG